MKGMFGVLLLAFMYDFENQTTQNKLVKYLARPHKS
jgi:hypothetical protein